MDTINRILIMKTQSVIEHTSTLIKSVMCIFFLILLPPGHSFCADPIVDFQADNKFRKTTIDEQWFSILVNEQVAGTFHHVVEMRHQEDHRVLVTCDSTVVDFETPRGSVTKRAYSEFTEDVNYTPVSFTRHITSEGESIVQKGTISENTLFLSEDPGGAEATTQLRWDDRTLFPVGKQNFLRKCGMKLGESYKLKAFIPSIAISKSTNTIISVLKHEPIRVCNQTRRLTKIRQTFEGVPNTVFYAWVDADCRVRKSVAHFGNMQIDLIERTEGDGFVKADRFFVTPLTKIDVVVQGKSIKQYSENAQLTISTLAEGGSINFPESPSLKVVSRQAQNIVLYVKKQHIKNECGYSIPCTDPNMKPYLKDNLYLSINDMKIKQYAFKAVGTESDAYEAAIKINNFVHKLIRRKKYLPTSLRTARWVADCLEGDCSEHAILVAAMARALGIPSRIASGLILTYRGTCECHMWTELYVGEWMATDAMFGQGIADALRIKVVTMTLNEEEDRMGILSKLSSAITGISKITVGPRLNDMK